MSVKTCNISLFDRKVLRKFLNLIYATFSRKFTTTFLPLFSCCHCLFPQTNQRAESPPFLWKGRQLLSFSQTFQNLTLLTWKFLKFPVHLKTQIIFQMPYFSWSFSLFIKFLITLFFLSPFCSNIAEYSISHCPYIKLHFAILSGRENNFHLFLFCTITKSFFQTQNWFIKL